MRKIIAADHSGYNTHEDDLEARVGPEELRRLAELFGRAEVECFNEAGGRLEAGDLVEFVGLGGEATCDYPCAAGEEEPGVAKISRSG
jgi:hypothetical protein